MNEENVLVFYIAARMECEGAPCVHSRRNKPYL
jgi:hypothetical protein